MAPCCTRFETDRLSAQFFHLVCFLVPPLLLLRSRPLVRPRPARRRVAVANVLLNTANIGLRVFFFFSISCLNYVCPACTQLHVMFAEGVPVGALCAAWPRGHICCRSSSQFVGQCPAFDESVDACDHIQSLLDNSALDNSVLTVIRSKPTNGDKRLNGSRSKRPQ
jgi:hypothetical protein